MADRASVQAKRLGCPHRRWGEYLVSILGGNIIYLFIEPQLPTVMQHRMFRVDLGLAIDFLICVLVYGVVLQFRGWDRTEI